MSELHKIETKSFLLGKVRIDISDADLLQIENIASRAISINPTLDHTELMMDLCAVHCNDMPLALVSMGQGNNSNLMHDIYGISAHLNRETCKLEDCFVPRYALGGE